MGLLSVHPGSVIGGIQHPRITGCARASRWLMKHFSLGRCDAQAASAWLLSGRDQSSAREPRQPRLHRWCSQREMAHRHLGVPHSGRQGVSVACDRLLRWQGGQLDDQHAPGRAAREHDAGCRYRDDRHQQPACCAFGSRCPLSMAGMAGTYRGCRADAFDVPQRLFARQCGLRGRSSHCLLPNCRNSRVRRLLNTFEGGSHQCAILQEPPGRLICSTSFGDSNQTRCLGTLSPTRHECIAHNGLAAPS